MNTTKLLSLDKYNNLYSSPFILCRPNNKRISVIPCTTKNASIKSGDYNEISFTTYMYLDGKKNNVYNNIKGLMHVEIPNVGRFVIDDVSIHSEGTKLEYKECNAVSEETLLGQKYLELFTINMGTVESIDGVQLYNLSDPSKSLLHLALQKAPNWTIGHVDNELYELQRCFEITRQDIYSFLMEDLSTAFDCVVIFDTLNHTVNVYKSENVGKNTNVHISFANLVKSVQVSYSTKDIKTCLKVIGADDLSLREVNMGYDSIYNIDYFHDLEYMSQGLYDAYASWKNLWNSKVDEYESLVTEYQKYYNKIAEITSTRMPEDPESTDWKLYGLNPLKEQLAAYEQKQAVMIKSGYGETTSEFYDSMYLPCYNTITAIKNQIDIVQKELDTAIAEQKVYGDKMGEIISIVDMENNFTKEQLIELDKYIREDELSSDNYVVTDTMTDSERMDMLHDMLEYGRKELSRVSTPEIQFSADILNVFAIPEFKKYAGQFNVSDFMYCSLRDDYTFKLRLLQVDVNLLDRNDMQVTFGNVKKVKKHHLFEDVTEAIARGEKAATSVSFNASNWSAGNKEASDIRNMIVNGLIGLGGNRLSSLSTDIIMDDRGIILKNLSDDKHKGDTIFLGGGQILFSDDDLKTIKTALGRIQYTKDGTVYDDFGLIAQFVLAGYIAGCTIEGNEIIAGTITGTSINNGNGTFSVDENGKMTANEAEIKGAVIADTGKIGGDNGFTIASGKIYSGSKSGFKDSNEGIYIGTDGIGLGKNSPFNVDKTGKLTASDAEITGKITAKSGSIGGAEIGSTYIKATNDNWKLDNSGIATFKGVHINGVAANSTFGSIVYNGTNTSGNFGGNSYYSSVVTAPFAGTCVSHVQSIAADYVYANYIRAIQADINAIRANYITADVVQANYMEVANWTQAGYIKADKIDVNQLFANSSESIFVKCGIFQYQRRTASWKSVEINGTTMFVLTGSDTLVST